MGSKRKLIKKQKKKGDNSERMFSESPWHMTNFFRRLDKFGEPLPAFNIKGEEEVKTVVGGILTFFSIILTLMYFASKL